MCGIAGILDTKTRRSQSELQLVAKRMIATLAHRGPDDEGAWADAASGIALANRRLAILDLSPAGHQPMHSRSGRFVLVFNGEIYNFEDLGLELQSDGEPPARGRSDTEVLLQCLESWGVEQTLSRLNGMFAFALWDRSQRVLYLCRDRLGEKPLYYGWVDGALVFGSELKALQAYPRFPSDINPDALALYMRHNCVPAPYCIYKNVSKLMPGTFLSVSFSDPKNAESSTYWSLCQVAERGIAERLGSDAEALERLDWLMRDSVRIRMISDVPLGVFLSGGIDSSVVAALMRSQASLPVRTFTIGLRETAYDEAREAKTIADHLETDHTEFCVTAVDALAVIPQLPVIYDEPFSDSSQIPTALISRLARQHVTVALSGDGGDELFGGYNRYVWASRIWRNIGWLSPSLRKVASRLIRSLSPARWDAIFEKTGTILPRSLKHRVPGYKMHKMALVMGARDLESMYMQLVSHWADPAAVVVAGREPKTLLTDHSQWPRIEEFNEVMMCFDMLTYLPDDILVKVDRASMASSLEARVPFLDHRLVEFAWRLPLNMKIRDGRTKWLLRQLLYRHVPLRLLDRPKMGFGIPLADWLRNPLRDWAESLLDAKRLEEDGLIHSNPIREKWEEHLAGRGNWEFHIWDILMFQAWLEHNRRAVSPPVSMQMAG
jgi:asparagine synthase (glutamine-hydrolysing)